MHTAYLQSLSQTPGQVHVLAFPNSTGSLNQIMGIKVAKEVGAFPLLIFSEATQAFQPVPRAAVFVVSVNLHPKTVGVLFWEQCKWIEVKDVQTHRLCEPSRDLIKGFRQIMEDQIPIFNQIV